MRVSSTKLALSNLGPLSPRSSPIFLPYLVFLVGFVVFNDMSDWLTSYLRHVRRCFNLREDMT